jgi:hypothetical protein
MVIKITEIKNHRLESAVVIFPKIHQRGHCSGIKELKISYVKAQKKTATGSNRKPSFIV